MALAAVIACSRVAKATSKEDEGSRRGTEVVNQQKQEGLI